MEYHYLDHNATTPLLPEAEEAMLRAMRDGYGNPSSLHAKGREARRQLENARETLAQHLSCQPLEIVFTSGGTEADNLALRGVMSHARAGGKRLVVSAFEHPAVLDTARDLATQGYELECIAPDSNGLVRPEALIPLLHPGTALVSVLMAHNEIGTVQPIAQLAQAAHAAGAWFHCDAVQALGKIGSIQVAALGVDFLSLSGHKIGGPKGAGVLYVRQGAPLHPQQIGGPQERQLRAGTENVAACVGMAAALKAWEKHGQVWRAHLSENRDALEFALKQLIPDLIVNGKSTQGQVTPRLPNTLHVTLPGCPSDLMVMALDIRGIGVSAGSACASGSVKRSQAMLAMGKSDAAARCVLRFSLGPDLAANAIPGIAKEVAAAAKAMEALAGG